MSVSQATISKKSKRHKCAKSVRFSTKNSFPASSTPDIYSCISLPRVMAYGHAGGKAAWEPNQPVGALLSEWTVI